MWWYLDAISDDGQHAIALIAFIGSVFSPFYFRAREQDGVQPYDHCAFNVGLYGPGRGRWAFTEYPRHKVRCERHSLAIAGNLLRWNGDHLAIDILERCAPLPARIRGTVRLYPEISTRFALALDQTGQHWWQPIIPRGRIEVRLEEPKLHWKGTAYLDSNDGSTPLDEAMQTWTWLRAHTRSGTRVIYDVIPVRAPARTHAFHFNESGEVQRLERPALRAVPASRWRIPRSGYSEGPLAPRVSRTLEDGPFYCRTLLETTLDGERVTAVHESLSLERFRSSWVRALLPFRMRRSRR